MNALRINRTIQSNDLHIDGLDRYKGKTAEIIILIDDSSMDNRISRKETAFNVINSYHGTVKKWSREELHER